MTGRSPELLSPPDRTRTGKGVKIIIIKGHQQHRNQKPGNHKHCLLDLLLFELNLLLDLLEVGLSHLGLVAVDDLGEFFEGGTLGLDVHEEDEGELEADPALWWSEETRSALGRSDSGKREYRGKLTV